MVLNRLMNLFGGSSDTNAPDRSAQKRTTWFDKYCAAMSAPVNVRGQGMVMPEPSQTVLCEHLLRLGTDAMLEKLDDGFLRIEELLQELGEDESDSEEIVEQIEHIDALVAWIVEWHLDFTHEELTDHLKRSSGLARTDHLPPAADALLSVSQQAAKAGDLSDDLQERTRAYIAQVLACKATSIETRDLCQHVSNQLAGPDGWLPLQGEYLADRITELLNGDDQALATRIRQLVQQPEEPSANDATSIKLVEYVQAWAENLPADSTPTVASCNISLYEGICALLTQSDGATAKAQARLTTYWLGKGPSRRAPDMQLALLAAEGIQSVETLLTLAAWTTDSFCRNLFLTKVAENASDISPLSLALTSLPTSASATELLGAWTTREWGAESWDEAIQLLACVLLKMLYLTGDSVPASHVLGLDAAADGLVWKMVEHTDTQTMMMVDGTWSDAVGNPIPLPDSDAQLSLWHPLDGDVEIWRERILELSICQPFSQVFRATYALDDECRADLECDLFAHETLLLPLLEQHCLFCWLALQLDEERSELSAPATGLDPMPKLELTKAVRAAESNALGFETGFLRLIAQDGTPVAPDGITAIAYSEICLAAATLVEYANLGFLDLQDGELEDLHEYWEGCRTADLSTIGRTRQDALQALVMRHLPEATINDQVLTHGARRIHLGAGYDLDSKQILPGQLQLTCPSLPHGDDPVLTAIWTSLNA